MQPSCLTFFLLTLFESWPAFLSKCSVVCIRQPHVLLLAVPKCVISISRASASWKPLAIGASLVVGTAAAAYAYYRWKKTGFVEIYGSGRVLSYSLYSCYWPRLVQPSPPSSFRVTRSNKTCIMVWWSRIHTVHSRSAQHDKLKQAEEALEATQLRTVNMHATMQTCSLHHHSHTHLFTLSIEDGVHVSIDTLLRPSMAIGHF